MNLKPVIGLEIHVQLKTKSKMFCACDNSGEEKPMNTAVCHVCMGHPGTLPVPNQTAIEWAIFSALALSCEIPFESKFDRKHYFYPDLPKGYQISQYEEPFGKNGFLFVGDKKIRINRLHLEEDAAKLLHSKAAGYTIIDFNRAGTPLMEIVTEPDIESPEIAGNALRELRAIMRSLQVSEADMEKGHLRCDANISLSEKENAKLNPKTEIKNLNSFKAVERALAYEIKRQTLLFEQKTPPAVESTRGWNEEKGITEEQRTKEAAHDYRYFPEPDIPPIKFKTEPKKLSWHGKIINLEAIKKTLPELPKQKRERFHEQYGFSISDANLLTRDYALADYAEKVMSELLAWMESIEQKSEENPGHRLAKLAANWLINNLAPLVKNEWKTISVSPENFAEFVSLILEGKISSRAGQTVLQKMLLTGADPGDIIQTENLAQTHDESELAEVVSKVIAENQKVIADFRAGKTNAIKRLMGTIMKETKGRANPKIAEELLKKVISESH